MSERDLSRAPIPVQIVTSFWRGLTGRSPLAHKGRVLANFAASGLRFAAGMKVRAPGPRPEKPLVVYEFEACPYCRKVREALSALDLEAEIRPCPKGGTRFRPEVEARGGRLQFPYLVDPNTGDAMYESDAIVAHLHRRYGTGRPPRVLNSGPVFGLSASAIALVRGGRGMRARPSRAPEKPLELYSFEASPYCALVRDALCELELPYLLHNVAKGSPRRAAFVERGGRMMVPFLVDPNTGVSMYESADIVAYLERTYAQPASDADSRVA